MESPPQSPRPKPETEDVGSKSCHVEPEATTGGRVRGFTQADWSALSFQEGGRWYQGYMPEAYTLPNDGEEQDRLDFMHTIMDILIDGKLGLAPVASPKHVLDIGTGTGIWAMDFAEQNPDSSVIGTDLALIQRHPPTKNCVFFLENSETADWSFPHTLDYVHLRFMGPCFQDVRTVIRKSFEYMTAGGWIEFQDGGWTPHCDDGTLEGTALQRWFQLIAEGGALLGFDMRKQRFYQGYLIDAGFVDIAETQILFPGNPWLNDPKMRTVGYYTGASLLQAIDTYRKFLEATGLTAGEVDELVANVKKDILNTSIHWYLAAYFVYGQKPSWATTVTPLPSLEVDQKLPSTF